MKSPVEWTEEDLFELINLKQEETLQLDFKRAESLDSNEKKKTEISKDVSAFANSAGGTIVYGIAESAMKPHFAEMLSPIDPTKYPKEWLEQVINSRIQPRIPGILINSVNLNSTLPGGSAYVACIPQSVTAHQASDHRYYKRYNFESVPMEDYEVRQTINRASRASYKVKLLPSQLRDRDYSRFFELSCVVENTSELVGRDVSVVLFLPKHLIVQPDDYEVPIDGAKYSRIPGTWILTSSERVTAIDAHPLTPYQIFFQRELTLALPGPYLKPLKVLVRVFDQHGLALTTNVLLTMPQLEVISSQDLPSLGMERQPNTSSF